MATFPILDNEIAPPTKETPGVSRRNFLKILGATSAVGATGCADKVTENLFPNVKGDNDTIPGVAAWFRSTCNECSAGCGIEVRTRDGRAVKIEGNPDHPVNRGGLCALGHSVLQAHYDPDRVRQPLARDAATGTFKPISWDEAYQKIKNRLGTSDNKKRLFVAGEMSGALDDLVSEFCKEFTFDRATFDLLQPVALAKASEMTFGTYGIPAYSIEKADVVVNFGADFLETWVSPCEYARDWAVTRKSDHPVRVVHIEPRLSLTGANADMWLAANPGSEVHIALYLLKAALDSGRGSNLREDLRDRARTLVSGVNIDSAAANSGVSKEKILLVTNYILAAKSSLVLAGGSAAATVDPLPLFITVNLLNMALGNVGTTINIAEKRVPRSSVAEMKRAIAAMQSDKVGVVFIHGTNPAFSLPSSYGFSEALKRVPLTVSLSSHLDESTSLADLVLPTNSSLESWGDSRSLPGVFSLSQPAMSPLWDTRMAGDIVMQIAAASGQEKVSGGAKNFEEYLKNSWSALHNNWRGSESGVDGDFKTFWLKAVERGGYFTAESGSSVGGSKVSLDSASFNGKFVNASFDAKDVESDRSLILMPFPSVHSFDGRAANRPWMMEIPDPITQTVWDAWAEIHPETAHRLGVAKGDFVTVRNFYGEVNVPVYLTDHVHHDVIAIPMGYGHSRGGRYAEQIQGANVLSLLPPSDANSGAVALLATRVTVLRGLGRAKLVNVMGSDSQLDRDLARTTMISGMAAASNGHGENHAENGPAAAEHGAEGHHGGEHHEIKQMYKQREHPLYRWGMAVDLSACTGCTACVVACYSENNIPVVGKDAQSKGREMSWLRIERYFDPVKGENGAEEFQVSFLPMMCQHCGSAPCEPVCPVYATYHNEDGLNAMVYNRCVGTRYCSNNCSYKVRRFNWYEYDLPEPMQLMLNPDVVKRTVGVMEKCTFCVQRITEAKDHAKDEGRMVRDGDIKPACVQSCPTQALVFGNLNDPESSVSKLAKSKRAYKVLDHHLNTQPAVSYMDRVRYEA